MNMLERIFGRISIQKSPKSSCKTRQSEKDRPLGHIEIAAETTAFRGLLEVKSGGHHHDGIPAQAPVTFEFAQHVYAATLGQPYIEENKQWNTDRSLAASRASLLA